MSIVRLAPITVDNWKEAVALKVAAVQVELVPENLYSIAEAQFYREAQALAICDAADQMVGFALYGRDVQSGKWKIFRLMIDASQQRKGYGRAAMVQLIEEIRRQPDCKEILIAYQSKNQVARNLYLSLGFVEEHGDGDTVSAMLNVVCETHS